MKQELLQVSGTNSVILQCFCISCSFHDPSNEGNGLQQFWKGKHECLTNIVVLKVYDDCMTLLLNFELLDLSY